MAKKTKIAEGQQQLDLVFDTNDLPRPVYVRDRNKLIKAYERAMKELANTLLKELAVKNPNDIQVVNTVKLMKQIELIIQELNAVSKTLTEDVVRQAFNHGQAVHLMKIAGVESYDEAIRQAGITQLSKDMIDSLIADTFTDLLVATTYMEENLKKTIRKVVSKVMQLKMAQNVGYYETAQLLMKELSKKGLSKTIIKEGFVGVIDRSGRKWNLQTYVDMVVKTKTQQAHVEGIRHQSFITGFDLAIISNHGADDECGLWENVIISVNGQTKGFPTYDQARSSKQIFHPNCEHTLLPIRSVDLVHPDILAEHKAKSRSRLKFIENQKK